MLSKIGFRQKTVLNIGLDQKQTVLKIGLDQKTLLLKRKHGHATNFPPAAARESRFDGACAGHLPLKCMLLSKIGFRQKTVLNIGLDQKQTVLKIGLDQKTLLLKRKHGHATNFPPAAARESRFDGACAGHLPLKCMLLSKIGFRQKTVLNIGLDQKQTVLKIGLDQKTLLLSKIGFRQKTVLNIGLDQKQTVLKIGLDQKTLLLKRKHGHATNFPPAAARESRFDGACAGHLPLKCMLLSKIGFRQKTVLNIGLDQKQTVLKIGLDQKTLLLSKIGFRQKTVLNIGLDQKQTVLKIGLDQKTLLLKRKHGHATNFPPAAARESRFDGACAGHLPLKCMLLSKIGFRQKTVLNIGLDQKQTVLKIGLDQKTLLLKRKHGHATNFPPAAARESRFDGACAGHLPLKCMLRRAESSSHRHVCASKQASPPPP